jgi:hypothetical protein
MILDHRIYTFKPGLVPEFLEMYEREALQIQIGHLGHLVGYFISDVGFLNQVIHIWGYDSVEDRERRRERLFADPAFMAFAKKVYPMLVSQENRLIKPASFSPIQ